MAPHKDFVSTTFMACALSLCVGCGDDGTGATDDGGTTGGTGGTMTDSTASTSTASTTGSTTASTTSDTSDTSDTTGDPDTGTTGAVELQILEVSPADGDAGVLEDAVIVVTFSEPMNQEATEAAYQSADLPADGVTFSWNDAGDELTITPNETLDYALGDDPDTLEALAYEWMITGAAEAEDGDVLGEDQAFTFTTARAFLQYFDPVLSLTGKLTDLGNKASTPYLGDYADTDTARYYATFDLSALAPDVVHIENAGLSVARVDQVIGAPFTELGGVEYARIIYDDLEDATFEIDPVGEANWLFEDASDVDVDVDGVADLEAVLADPGTYGGRIQYRFAWSPDETNGDNMQDGITLDPAFEFAALYLAK